MTSQTRSCTVLTSVTSDSDAHVLWRDDIDSLAFRPPDHRGLCVMHRRAFRVFLGRAATPQQCVDYFHMQRAAFERAAHAKIARAALAADAYFHINSRDVRATIGAIGDL